MRSVYLAFSTQFSFIAVTRGCKSANSLQPRLAQMSVFSHGRFAASEMQRFCVGREWGNGKFRSFVGHGFQPCRHTGDETGFSLWRSGIAPASQANPEAMAKAES
jgi:hypothetical protein